MPGLRIHECFRIDTATAEQALREHVITIKGKGGKIRTVPINEQITIAMREQLKRTKRGHKLLVPERPPPTGPSISFSFSSTPTVRIFRRTPIVHRPSMDFGIPTPLKSTWN